MIPFGEWRPDMADLDSSFVRECRNVLPADGFYGPAQALSELSNALSTKIVGGVLVPTASGSYSIFAGIKTALYKYNSGAWTDFTRLVGGAYAVPEGELWEWAKYGNLLIATNIANEMQVTNIGSGTSFANLGGSPPLARHIKTINQYLVASGLAGDLKSIQWNGIADETAWTIGTAGSDKRTFLEGGDVGRICGGETALVMQKDGIQLMQFQPTGSVAFTLEKVENARGCYSPYAAVQVGSATFYPGLDGFYAANASSSQPIGLGYVDEWFKANADQSKLTTMLGLADPRSKRVLWLFKSNGGGSAPYDKIIGYDWGRQKWFYTVQDLEYAMTAATLGYTLEQLSAFGTLDTLPASLDSASWRGGLPDLAGFSTNHKLGFFNGPNLEALLETAEAEPIKRKRTFLSRVVPYVDTIDVGVSIGTRDTFKDALVYGAEGVYEADGSVTVLASGRFIRGKVRVPAGKVWTKAQGYDVVDPQPDGDV